MKFKTVALVGVGALLSVFAILGAGVYFFLASLDEIVEVGIEKYGSEIVGTSVSVGSVSIDLEEGKGTILGLRVKSPKGFPPGDAISFGEITLGIDIESLITADPIVINVVKVADPSVAWSINSERVNNISVLEENATRYVDRLVDATTSGEPEAPEPSEPSSEEEEVPMLISIKKFSFEGGKLTADLSEIHGPVIETKLIAVRLSNLGGDAGVTPEELGAVIALEFSKSVKQAIANSAVTGKLNDLLGKGFEKMKERGVKGLLKGLFGKDKD
jgi:hypothetical protein